jgi:hypothetical protein
MKSGAKPLFFREKMNPSSKYEANIRSLHQNTKSKKSSSKYEVRYEAFIFQRKNKTFIKIRSQSVKPSSKDEAKVRSLRQNTKPKKHSSKYEVRCEASILREKIKPSSKYEAKVRNLH